MAPEGYVNTGKKIEFRFLPVFKIIGLYLGMIPLK